MRRISAGHSFAPLLPIGRRAATLILPAVLQKRNSCARILTGPDFFPAVIPFSVLLVRSSLCVLQLHSELDDAAGAKTVRAEIDEVLRVLDGGDAAGGLNLQRVRGELAQERNVFAGSAALAEARGGLDEVGSRGGDDRAQTDLFLLRQQAALDDDLQDLALRGLAHGGNVLLHLVPAAVLDHGEVDDHIDLVGAVGNRVRRLKCLGRRGAVAVWEADHGAEREPVADVALRAGQMAGRDADAGAVIFDGLIAELADLGRSAVDPKKGMVAFFKDIFEFHRYSPFSI